MKIYKADGTFTEDPQDTAFGWNIDDVAIAERKENGYKTTVVLLKEIASKIHIEEAHTVLDFNLNCENIDHKVPSNTQVASLINPCSVESKMLLSVAHYAKYKNLKRDVENLGDLTANSSLRFLLNSMGEDIEGDLRHAINNYFENEEDKVLSLMMELILTNTRSGLDDIAECPNGPNGAHEEHSFHGRSPESKAHFEDNMDVLKNAGISTAINTNIRKISEETCDIHDQICEIRKSFQSDDTRVEALIENARLLERSLRETKFLEDLVHLLDGNLDKVVLKKCPFRIFLDPSDADEPNLIV